jgi:hypothetical protein
MVDRRAVRVTVAVSAVLMLAAGGCSPTTRLPTLFPGPGDTDARSFSAHDPLPEQGIAPDMAARPPGFMDDWSEPKRTRAGQDLLGVPPGGAPVAPGGGIPTGPGPGPMPGGPVVAPGQPIGPGPSGQLYPNGVPQ